MTARQKGTVEAYRTLSAGKLKREGALTPGHQCEWGWWNRDGERTSSISLTCLDRETLRFSYNCAGEAYDYSVGVEWLPCHMGGERAMFRCPCCGKRCAKLLADKVFACRSCVGVNYSSQQRAKRDVALGQSWKLRQKLGCDHGMLDIPAPCIPKPKWMRCHTHQRLIQRIEHYDQRALEGLEQQLCQMLGDASPL